MMPASVASVVVFVLIAMGVIIGWLFTSKHEAEKRIDMENNLRAGIDRALERARNAEKKYVELATKIDSARTADDFNQLYAEIRKQLQSS